VLVQFERLVFRFIFDFHCGGEGIKFRLEDLVSGFFGREEFITVASEIGINSGVLFESCGWVMVGRLEEFPFLLYAAEAF